MSRELQLSDYLRDNPVKVKPDMDLFEAIDVIISSKITGVCVVDDNDNLVGVLSELDCLRAVLSAYYDNQTRVGSVADFMTREVVTSGSHEDIVDVAEAMLKSGHRRRPVVDQHGSLVGQVTCRQLLQGFKAFYQR